MGGINCGNSNGRVFSITSYRLNYAEYMKYYFEGLKLFFESNVAVENFTVKEVDSTEEAIELYKESLSLLDKSILQFNESKKYLIECSNVIKPLYKYDKIKNAVVEGYRSINSQEIKSILEENSLTTSENTVWKEVVSNLQNGGEVEYLKYQETQLNTLIEIVSKLKFEYLKLDKYIQSGTSHVAMRDLDVKVTPFTAQALAKINDISSSISYLCILEYTSHTSVSGKNVTIDDFVINSSVENLLKAN